MSALIKNILVSYAGSTQLASNEISYEELINLNKIGLLNLYIELSEEEHVAKIQNGFAELSSRLLMEKFESAARYSMLDRVLKKITENGIHVTLLKGVYFAKYIYRRPEFRGMGDIDLLVEQSELARVREIMFDLGFIQKTHLPREFYKTHHHEIAFYHPVQNVWIEVHHAIMPDSGLTKGISLFGNKRRQYTGEIEYEDMQHIYAFSSEFNLLYIIMHWANEIEKPRAPVMFFDVVSLLKNNSDMDVEKVVELASEEPRLVNTLYIVVQFLLACGIQHQLLQELRTGLKTVHNIDPVQYRISAWFIERYVFQQKPAGTILTERIISSIWYGLLNSKYRYLNVLNVLRSIFSIVFEKLSNRKKANLVQA